MSGSKTSEVTVVIPVRNGAATIGDQLRALDAQNISPDVSVDIVIADNGSTDATIDLAIEAGAWLGHDLRIVDASDAVGPSHARNRGASNATTEHVLFCDADDIVGPDWIQGHITALHDHTLSTGPLARFDDPTDRTLAEPAEFLDQAQWAGSGNLGVDRAAFVRSGGFDESLQVAEDIEFCVRLQNDGATLGWSDDALLRIRERGTLIEIARQHYRWGQADVEVYVRHSNTLERPSLTQQLAPWKTLARLTLSLRSSAARRRWVWRAAKQAGRLRGSIRHGTLLL
jgi:glycosyltransferase involved in cell wall biosynthesis